MQTTEIAARAP